MPSGCRQIKPSTRVSVGAIQKLLNKADTLGLGWPLPDELDDHQLARLFYPGADTRASNRFQIPDWSALHQEINASYQQWAEHYQVAVLPARPCKPKDKAKVGVQIVECWCQRQLKIDPPS